MMYYTGKSVATDVNKVLAKNGKLSRSPSNSEQKVVETKGLNLDRKSISKVNRQNGNGVNKNPPDDCSSVEERHIQDASDTTFSTEAEKGREWDNIDTETSLLESDKPELVVFLQDSNYDFVKDIFIDREVSAQKQSFLRCGALDHEKLSYLLHANVDHKRGKAENSLEKISYLIHANVDGKGGKAENSLGKVSSISDGIEPDLQKHVIQRCGHEKPEVEDNRRPDEIENHRPRQVPAKAAVPVDSMALPGNEATNHDSHTREASYSSEEESAIHCSDFSLSTVSSLEGSRQIIDNEEPYEAATLPPLGYRMTRSPTDPTQSFLHEPENGRELSGPMPCSGSNSLRSNGSTGSSHSFAFPILTSEWNGSPVRMAKADQNQSERRQNWIARFFCCT